MTSIIPVIASLCLSAGTVDTIQSLYYVPDDRLRPATYSMIDASSGSIEIAAQVLTDSELVTHLKLALSRSVVEPGDVALEFDLDKLPSETIDKQRCVWMDS